MTPRGDCRAASPTLGPLTGRWALPVLHEVTFDARRHHEVARAGSGHIGKGAHRLAPSLATGSRWTMLAGIPVVLTKDPTDMLLTCD
jgi:hypothetical protein